MTRLENMTHQGKGAFGLSTFIWREESLRRPGVLLNQLPASHGSGRTSFTCAGSQDPGFSLEICPKLWLSYWRVKERMLTWLLCPIITLCFGAITSPSPFSWRSLLTWDNTLMLLCPCLRTARGSQNHPVKPSDSTHLCPWCFLEARTHSGTNVLSSLRLRGPRNAFLPVSCLIPHTSFHTLLFNILNVPRLKVKD